MWEHVLFQNKGLHLPSSNKTDLQNFVDPNSNVALLSNEGQNLKKCFPQILKYDQYKLFLA